MSYDQDMDVFDGNGKLRGTIFEGFYMGIDRSAELPKPKPKKIPLQRAMSDQARHYLRKAKKRNR